MGSPEGLRPESAEPFIKIADILQAHGRSGEIELPSGMPYGKNTRIGFFLDAAGFPSHTLFGQFAILTETAGLIGTEMRKIIRNGTRHGEITQQAQSKLDPLQTLLRTMHTVRNEIGEEIFGDKADKYLEKFTERLEHSPIGGSRHMQAKRREWYATFGDEIRADFPRAMETK